MKGWHARAVPGRYARGMPNRTTLIAAGTIVALVLAGLVYMAYGAAQKKNQQRHVKELVVDTTEKLRQALVAKTAPDVVASLDANLKAARAPRDPKLADAAEHYIIGAREIARRRAEVDRWSRQADASRHTLTTHMANSASGSRQAWMDRAIALRKKVEEDYFQLNTALKGLDELLYTMPDAEERLAPLVGRGVLLDTATLDAARKETKDQMRRAADDYERVRWLNRR